MTKKLRTELAADIDALEQQLDEMDRRLIQIEQRRALRLPTTEQAWAARTPSWLSRLLNGSWPQRDGNTYPRIHDKGPIGGYESYVRRSPPATE